MSIDAQRYNSPATKGEVGRVAIQASLAVFQARVALRKLSEKLGVDLSEDLEALDEVSKGLDKAFDELTGYAPDA